MSDGDQPLINGSMVGWVELGITAQVADGEAISTRGFIALDWSQTVDTKAQYGTGGNPVGRVIGQKTLEASMTMYRRDAKALWDALAKKDAKLATVVFDITANWSPLTEDGGTSEEVLTASIIGCTMKASQVTNAPGGDSAVIVMPLCPMNIIDMGHSLL